MKIIDSKIMTREDLLDKVGELKPGDSALIQCKSETEWADLPTIIQEEFPWTRFRQTRAMDDLTPILKVKVLA